MGIVVRQSVKSTIVIFAGNILGALFIYLSSYVFKDDMQGFGFSRTIFNISVIFQLMILMGSGAVIQLYTPRYKPDDIRKKVLTALCSLTPFVALVILLPFYLLLKGEIISLFQPGDQPFFMQYYIWIPVLVILWSYVSLYELYLISHHKSAQAVFMREVLLRIGNLVLLGVFYFKLISFSTFIIGSVLMYALPALVLVFLAMRTEGFGFSLKWKAFRRNEYIDILKFAWYHLLAGISFSLIGFLDALMLAAIDKQGVASIPVYNMAVFIVSITTVPYRAMTNAVYPVLNQAYIENDQHKLKDTFQRSGVNILIVTVAMLTFSGSGGTLFTAPVQTVNF